MKFTCYSDWQQLPESVSLLFALAGKESMFLTREWFEALHATSSEDGQSLLLASVVSRDCVLALLPLNGADDHWHAFSHRYTALFGLLLAETDRAAVLDCLAAGLSQRGIHALQLQPVAEDDRSLIGLQAALESAGYQTHRHFAFYNWIHRTRGQSFDDYMAARPAQLRNTINRKRRKLAREQEYSIRLYKDGDVAQGLREYHSAYAASWKANEQYAELLDTVAMTLSVPGWTRIAVLAIDGKAVAAQLWFVVQGKASIFRLAYDEQWKRYSPGSILTAYLMQYVMDTDKVEEIDFLTGNDAYKQDWMSVRRQRCRLLFVKPREAQRHSGNWLTRLKNIFKPAINVIHSRYLTPATGRISRSQRPPSTTSR